MSNLDYKEGRGDYYLAAGKREERPGLSVDELGELMAEADFAWRNEYGRRRTRSRYYWRDMATLIVRRLDPINRRRLAHALEDRLGPAAIERMAWSSFREPPEYEGDPDHNVRLNDPYPMASLAAAIADAYEESNAGLPAHVPNLTVERLAKALALVNVTDHPIKEALEHWESYRTDATEIVAAYGAVGDLPT